MTNQRNMTENGIALFKQANFLNLLITQYSYFIIFAVLHFAFADDRRN